MFAPQDEATGCDADFETMMCHRSGPRAQGPVPTGSYREHRRGFVMWIANKANRFSLKTITIHYATNYLDRCFPICSVLLVWTSIEQPALVLLNMESDSFIDDVFTQGHAFVAFASRKVSRPRCRLPPHRSEIRGQFEPPPPVLNPAQATVVHPAFPAFLCLSPKGFACADRQLFPQERPDMVPYISELVQEERQQSQHHLEASEIAQFEVLVLKILDWRLHCSTYIHYLDLHKSQGNVCEGDMIEDVAVTEKTRSKLMKYLTFFADMLLLDADFCSFPMPISAAAIVATGRLTMRIEPMWPQSLAATTGLSVPDIADCVNQMVVAFCRDWPDAAPVHLRKADQTPKFFVLTTCHPGQVPVLECMETLELHDMCHDHNVVEEARVRAFHVPQSTENGENKDANVMMLDSPRDSCTSHETSTSVIMNDTCSSSMIDDATWNAQDLACGSYLGVGKTSQLREGDSWCSSANTIVGAEEFS